MDHNVLTFGKVAFLYIISYIILIFEISLGTNFTYW